MSSQESAIKAREESIARLIGANAELRKMRGRMKWIAVATAVLSALAYFVIGHTVGVFVLVVGGSAFFVGHYVVYAHIQENKLTIKSAKQMIAALRDGRASS